MPLKIYDTFQKKKLNFTPLKAPKVKVYCCGPTVYDYLHIGNFRGAVFFNLVRNWLEFLGYQVDFIYNFTDIDDKILNRAQKEQVHPRDISEKYIQEFKKDFEALQLKPHTHQPKATETIKEIINLIQKIIKAGKAYEVDGDVFYSVTSFDSYGHLSGHQVEDLLSGVRVEVNDKKKQPLDFSLWKKSKPEEGWSWDSPWGKGRPGWHIECTAMIHKFLGQEIDIHGGGSDLIFPHHENERAQSEACYAKKYVRYWMHNNMIVSSGDKMSKSLGNIMTMRSFLKDYPGEVFKYLILSAHYRSEAQFSKKTIYQSIVSLSRLYSYFLKAHQLVSSVSQEAEELVEFKDFLKKEEEAITDAFNDDFATPKVFSCFFSVLNFVKNYFQDQKISPSKRKWCAQEFLAFFKKYGEILSLFQEEPKGFLKNLDDYFLKQKNLSRSEIDQLVQERSLARSQKDFKSSDQIRQNLEDKGIEVQDTPEGTIWEVNKALL